NGRPLELNYVDVQAKPELAASAAERMINVDNTPMILGGDTSATCAAIAKLAQQNKVPYLMHVCLSDDLTRQGWEYVFRIPPPIGKGLDGVTGFLQSVVKPQSFFLVHENTQYGTGIEASLKEWASDNQIS